MGPMTRIGLNLLPSRSSVRLLSTFRYDDLHINLTSNPKPKTNYDELKFGHTMTDHMLEIDWSLEHGWSSPVIRPVEHLRIHPAAKVLHYATELFEGMKAMRCVDNKIRLFRPMENMKRMAQSTDRCALPAFDQHEFLKCIKKLITIDQEWVPYSDNCSLYMRPTFIGTDPTLGVSMSNEAKLYTIISPVGPYFPSGIKGISLLADPQYVRAWPGGCGSFKMGSNYASTMKVHQIALQKNCQQLLWLYGDDLQITEAGTMNFFVFWINEQGVLELITPPLESGLILPGIIRKSLLELAREWNEFKVTEGSINMPTFCKALKEGRVKEFFGSGTAALVCPVDRIVFGNEDLIIPSFDKRTSLALRFHREMNDIMYGRRPHPWMESLDIEEESITSADAQ